MTHDPGVCSWSLQPKSPQDLVDQMQAVGLRRVQLALDPLRTQEWSFDETVRALKDAGISIASGMMGMKDEDYSTLESIKRTGGVRPDEHWKENLEGARATAGIAHRLGLSLVTFHAGFIPHDPGDEHRPVLIDRLRSIADCFAEEGVEVGLETGQETASTLVEILEDCDRPTIGVNFDPANMLLYGMGEPVESLRRLTPRVSQIHIKDALPTQKAGTWGEEVPVGRGAVNWESFFGVYHRMGMDCELMIEREAGDDRVGDIRIARELVDRIRGNPS